MPATIFYSWQSDSDKSVNRNFIEDALKKAIRQLNRNEDVLSAMRDEDSVELDKDTQDVPGSPPIVQTILEKISNAAVFVPDLTIVGKSSSDRLLPNPNVLIEYGWALKSLGHDRIVSVVNKAFWNPAPENMPFDIRHMRHPITYHLSETDGPEQKKKVKDELAKKLEYALALVFNQMPLEDANAFVGQLATFSPSAFWEKGETFSFNNKRISIPDVPRMFLHLIPNKPLTSIETNTQALELIKTASLQPMNNRDGYLQYCRNKYGSFSFSIEKKQVYENEADLIRRSKTVRWLSQLFKTGEIWGVDCFTLDTLNRDQLSPSGYFPSDFFEDIFVNTLDSYLKFAREKLQITLPLKLIAGVDNVKDFKMKINSGRNSYWFEGNIVDEHLIKKITIDNYDTPPRLILMPFFKYVWEECGLTRPDKESLG
ncbi:hypothetical protein [Candidatus Electronema sp. JC]|uniref:hypothetical protein n=1 Tax=Candidatus Electronema sp. JC TaxID=3401570 RepID=UPI003B43434E